MTGLNMARALFVTGWALLIGGALVVWGSGVAAIAGGVLMLLLSWLICDARQNP